MAIRYISALAGAGKTRALVRRAVELARFGENVLFVQPTKDLIAQTIRDELRRIGGDVPHYECHGETDEHVVAAIDAHFKADRDFGHILFVTHSAFLRVRYFHRSHAWNLIVDEVFNVVQARPLAINESHSFLTVHLGIQVGDGPFGALTVANVKGVRAIAATTDDGLKAFAPVAYDLTNSDKVAVYVDSKRYSDLLAGRSSRKETCFFTVTLPSVVHGFHSVTIAAACFEESLLFLLWSHLGVQFERDTSLDSSLRFTRHTNGEALTLFHLNPEHWTRRLRTKDVDGEPLLKLISGRLVEVFGGEPTLIHTNKDMLPDQLETSVPAKPLPRSTFGLNQFQELRNVAFLSSLNPAPEQFRFLKAFGVEPEDVKRAIYHQAVYQAVMRCALRNPQDGGPKKVLVMDRGAASYLADKFSGCSVHELDWIPKPLLSAKPLGRPKEYESGASRTQAHRERMRFLEAFYSLVSADTCNENTINNNIVTSPIHLSVYASYRDDIPGDDCEVESFSDLCDFLENAHEKNRRTKKDSKLFNLAKGTGRKIEDVGSVGAIVLDYDGGGLKPQDVSMFFDFCEMAAFNTHSSKVEKLKYRVVFSLSRPVNVAEYRRISRMTVDLIGVSGVPTRGQNPFGFDKASYNPVQLWVLPAKALEADATFFHRHEGGKRRPIDVDLWLSATPPALAPEQRVLPSSVDQVRVDAAIARWQSAAPLDDQGNGGLFRLGLSLAAAGMHLGEMEPVLREQAQFGRRPGKRASQVPSILKSLSGYGFPI